MEKSSSPLLDQQTILDALHCFREFVQARNSYCVRQYGETLVDDLRVLARVLKASLKTSSPTGAPCGGIARVAHRSGPECPSSRFWNRLRRLDVSRSALQPPFDALRV